MHVNACISQILGPLRGEISDWVAVVWFQSTFCIADLVFTIAVVLNLSD